MPIRSHFLYNVVGKGKGWVTILNFISNDFKCVNSKLRNFPYS